MVDLLPELWGLSVNDRDHLMIGDVDAIELADEYDTPVYIVNEDSPVLFVSQVLIDLFAFRIRSIDLRIWMIEQNKIDSDMSCVVWRRGIDPNLGLNPCFRREPNNPIGDSFQSAGGRFAYTFIFHFFLAPRSRFKTRFKIWVINRQESIFEGPDRN